MAVVLVVDDSLLARHTVRLALRSQHEVLEASDGIAGLLVARACMPDVVIAAKELPATSGEALLHALAREGHGVPGILIETPGSEACGGESRLIRVHRPLSAKGIRGAVERALAAREVEASKRAA